MPHHCFHWFLAPRNSKAGYFCINCYKPFTISMDDHITPAELERLFPPIKIARKLWQMWGLFRDALHRGKTLVLDGGNHRTKCRHRFRRTIGGMAYCIRCNLSLADWEEE